MWGLGRPRGVFLIFNFVFNLFRWNVGCFCIFGGVGCWTLSGGLRELTSSRGSSGLYCFRCGCWMTVLRRVIWRILTIGWWVWRVVRLSGGYGRSSSYVFSRRRVFSARGMSVIANSICCPRVDSWFESGGPSCSLEEHNKCGKDYSEEE